jgi:hypothetical protein
MAFQHEPKLRPHLGTHSEEEMAVKNVYGAQLHIVLNVFAST